MKAVLISIRPKWVEKIASGKKTIEVRKTRPKLETPFKCYIYETQGRTDTPWVDEDGHMIFAGRGQVIGEFVCDCVTPLYNVCTDDWKRLTGGIHRIEKELVNQACLTEAQLHTYAGGKNCFAWHISDLEIYDRPKELSEFKGLCKIEADCCACPYYNYTKMDCDGRKIKRPPQSWCYVEAME
jgi:predicted transcriptional regulator